MSSESLKPEKEKRKKKEKGRGRRRAWGICVKWRSEKLRLAESTRSLSLPVVVPGLGSSLICLWTWKKGDGGVWRRVIPEGFVTLCGGDTSEDPHSGQPMPPLSPPLKGRRVSMASHSHTRVFACLAADLYSVLYSVWLYWTLHWLDWHVLKSLFVQLLQPEVDSFFCFCGEIFPQHTTVPIPQPWVSRTKEASVCFWN